MLGVAVGELVGGLLVIVGSECLTVHHIALLVIDGAVHHIVIDFVACGLPRGYVSAVGDFLGGLYLLIGGTGMDAQACLDVLAENGLADASQDLNAPLTEKYLCDLLTSIGAQMTTDTPDHIMTRGELAELFVMLNG